jgi:murein DD-endopeptidase MepM/ murein hydrolase activator NlpD
MNRCHGSGLTLLVVVAISAVSLAVATGPDVGAAGADPTGRRPNATVPALPSGTEDPGSTSTLTSTSDPASTSTASTTTAILATTSTMPLGSSSTTMPSTSMPSTTMPSTTMPSTTMPSSTMPSTTMPSSSTIPTLTELPEAEADPGFHLADLVGEDVLDQIPFDPNVNRVVASAVHAAQAERSAAEQQLQSLTNRRTELRAQQQTLRAEVAGLAGNRRRELDAAAQARGAFEARAVEAYIRGGDAELTVLFGAENANDLAARSTLLDAVFEADDAAIEEYVARRAALDEESSRLLDRLAQVQRDVSGVERALPEARRALAAARVDEAMWQAGSQVAVAAFVFPVFGANSFGDSYGAPRMAGTSVAHWHQGTDIMAATGTPLVAVEGGRIVRLTEEALGGIGLFLQGDSGIEYFYAHLSRYAPGLHIGQRVVPGEVIGHVGRTGNAVGAHLHFEVEVGGRNVNPYPMLRVAWDWQAPYILDAAAQLAALPPVLEVPAEGGLAATAPTLDGPGATLPPLRPGEVARQTTVPAPP